MCSFTLGKERISKNQDYDEDDNDDDNDDNGDEKEAEDVDKNDAKKKIQTTLTLTEIDLT